MLEPFQNSKDLPKESRGAVTRIRGSVVDVEFPSERLPPINDALIVDPDGDARLVVEVQEHLDQRTIRGVAMENTAGLRRGTVVCQTGGQRNVEHYVAVRGGVLRVRDGKVVEIATREAVVSDDLGHLRSQVLSAMIKNVEAEQSARSGALRLEHAAIRRIYRYLRPTDQPIKGKPQE
jgi:F0F1-type ATP synthase beta subunit